MGLRRGKKSDAEAVAATVSPEAESAGAAATPTPEPAVEVVEKPTRRPAPTHDDEW